MKNAEYWRQRQEDLQNNLMKKADDLIPKMEEKYQTAINDIDKEIQSFYERFAKNESLTMAEAKKILDSDERKAFQMDLNEYIKKGEENGISADWEKQLESASDIHRIDRLRALQMQMREKVEELSGYKQNTMDKTLGGIYEEGYYQNIYEIQKYVGTGSAFATLDQNKINKVLAKPWTYDNQTYSDKIWQNRDRLNYALDKALTQGIIRGQAPDKVSRQIAKELGMELSNAKRLVLTESAAFSSLASQDSYKELGVEKVEYLATLDDKTCEICGPMDGQVFDLKDFEMSVNAPPLHPRCRCTTIPYFNDEFTQGEKRAARDSEGKSYTVPGDMSYQQWKEKYVDNTRENDIIKTVRGRIKSGEQPINIDKGKQGKHIKGHNNYIDGRSYLTVSMDEAQELVNKYAGTGKIVTNRKGEWKKQEIIKSDKMVGVDIDGITGVETPTSYLKIHYSKTGVHIVPYMPKE